jgi:hypothetical protein
LPLNKTGDGKEDDFIAIVYLKGYDWKYARKEYPPMTSFLTVLVFAVLLIAAFAGTMMIRNFLTRRAVSRVIRIFYDQRALTLSEAKTLPELGLQRPDLLQRMTKPRDYRQSALQILMRQGVIHVSAEGRLYLVEQNLNEKLRRVSRDDAPSRGTP